MTLFHNPAMSLLRRQILSTLLLFGYVACCATRANAQSESLSTSPAPVVTVAQTAYVQFDSQILFPVYTSGNDDAVDREQAIESRLNAAWQTRSRDRTSYSLDPASTITVNGDSGVMIDGKRPFFVTAADTTATGELDDQLAAMWAQKINAAFAQKYRETQPAYRRWAIEQALIILGLGASVFIILFYIVLRWHVRRPWELYLIVILYTSLKIVALFPPARSLMHEVSLGTLRPLFIIVFTSIPAAALARIWAIVLHRLVPPLPEHISAKDLVRRTNLRRRTLAAVAEVTGASIIWFFAIVIGLSWYGVNLSSLLTSAGLIGVALGLVAQDSIRDTLSGIYILADDRYGVGDLIKVGEYEGRVERFNLRMTQIRDTAGRLITLSNRSTTEVANLTARWSQVDFKVGISYYDNIEQALSVLEETAGKLADEWKERVLEKPQMMGVDSFNDLNITLRVLVKTAPGDQSVVGHELRKRVKLAFDGAGIAILNDVHKAA